MKRSVCSGEAIDSPQASFRVGEAMELAGV